MKPVTSVVSTRRKLATAIAAAGLLVGTLGHAWAASPEERLRDVENRIDQAEEELNHSSTALSEATAAYEAAVGALPAAETALANAQASHVAALDALRVAQAEVVAAKAADAAAAKALQEAIQKVEDQKVKIADVSDEIDDKRASASQIAATAYQQGGGNQLANMFAALQGESLSDVTSNTVAAQSVVAAESEIMSDLKNDRARLSNERVVLEDLEAAAEAAKLDAEAKLEATKEREAAAQQAKDAAAVAEQEATAAKAAVDQLVADREAARDQAQRVKEADANQYEKFQRERAAIQREIDEIARREREEQERRERERREREERERQERDSSRGGGGGGTGGGGGSDDGGGSGGGGGGGSDGGSSSGLRYPVSNPVVTSPYGMRVHPITGIYKLHDGTDFRAYCGTPIRAAADGTVQWANYRGGYGNQVAISHGGKVTTYSHLSRFSTHSGERVARGEVIGYSGSTGYSTACHLHFMLYVDGSLRNPMNYL